MKIGIITGTVRKSRKSIGVAKFVMEVAENRKDENVEYEVVDIKDFNLPLFDEAVPPAASKERETEEGKAWVKKLATFDGYIFVTAEYNRSIPGSLKNATDYVGTEFRNKSAAIISYGVTGGNSAVDHLRLVISRLGLTVVSQQPYFMIMTDFDSDQQLLSTIKENSIKAVDGMLDATVKTAKLLK